MDEYRFVGSHPDELDGGRPIEPGEFAGSLEVDEDHPKNKSLLEDGLLVKIEQPVQEEDIPKKAGAKAKADDDKKEG